MSADNVLILIRDKENPATPELEAHVAAEAKFLESYLAKNGIPWRHYYGELKSIYSIYQLQLISYCFDIRPSGSKRPSDALHVASGEYWR